MVKIIKMSGGNAREKSSDFNLEDIKIKKKFICLFALFLIIQISFVSAGWKLEDGVWVFVDEGAETTPVETTPSETVGETTQTTEPATPETDSDSVNRKISSQEDITDDLDLKSGQAVGQNIQIVRGKGETKSQIIFENNGAVTINGRTHSNLGSINVNGETKSPQIFVDKNGRVIEAYFKTGKSGEYVFGNEKVNLPEGASVVFKDGKARVTLPADSKLPPAPISIDGNQGESAFYFKNENNAAFDLQNRDKFYGELGYKQGKLLFDAKEVKVGNLDVSNPNSVETYILFDGEVHNEIKAAYISMDKTNGKLTLGCNIDVRCASVKFSEGATYGINIEKGDNFAMQALGNSQGSYIKVQDRTKEGKVPLVETLNQYVFNVDNKGQYYHFRNQKLYIRANEVVIKDFGDKFEGSSSTPLEVHNFKTENGKKVSVSKYNNKLGIGNLNNFGYGPNPWFIKTHVLDYYKGRMRAPGLFTGFSNSLIYNYEITERGVEKLIGVNIIDDAGVLKNPQDIRMVMDLFMSVPTNDLRKWGIRTFKIVNYRSGWSGLADSGGTFYVSYPNGGFRPGTIKHEMTHMHDFIMGRSFSNEWRAVGGNRGPHTWSYGYQGAEDTSTFGEMIYKDSWGDTGSSVFGSWKAGLSSDYQHHKRVRGKVAVFEKYGFISMSEAQRVFRLAGLDYNEGLREQYIKKQE